ncbi:MAG TPA: DUF1343 domain-containing protein [Gemmataceae bacterium]|nr:DUF1343 domain-containing protein [Gemmataceae bacterium]
MLRDAEHCSVAPRVPPETTAAMIRSTVQTGLDILIRQGFQPLRGRRVGLVTNPAGVDARLCHIADLLAEAGDVRLAALFGPEHGFGAEAQDLIGVADAVHPSHGCPVHSLYGDSVESLRPKLEHLRELDVLVIDLPDIGSRYYTFQATMLFCLEAAAECGLPVIVLDRPNPLNGVTVEGPTIRPGFESFVGAHPIATRHGLTLGELASLYVAERRIQVSMEIIPCVGWRRDQYFDETGLPWVLPSPNMPTLDTAIVYPGQSLIEGTNLSEGRGTTRPFEIIGAPWVSAERVLRKLASDDLPGATFRALSFRPTFHKFTGELCGGVQIHVTDRKQFRPVRTSLALLAAMRTEGEGRIRWRMETYEFVSDKPAIDLLFGSDRERLALDAGVPAADISRAWEDEEAAFAVRTMPYLLY